jgi:hypothetical protein
MKKTLVLSLLIPFALVCSCQKQDSTAEQQLAQRKTELDAREKALDEREKLVARRRVAPVPRPAPGEPQRTVPPDLQGLMGKMQEIQRRRVPAVPRDQATVPATEQVASPIPSPTPE